LTTEEKILSEAESDALLAESDPGDSVDRNVAEAGVRDVDHSQWEQVALDRIPSFEAINDDIAEAVDSVWADLCRKSIVTSPKGFQKRLWRDYLRELQAPLNVNLIEIQPRGELGLVVLRPETVYAMVDLFFGGTAHGDRQPGLTQLTQMEARLGQRFTAELTAPMQEAWSHHTAIELKPSETVFDPDTTPIASPSDQVVVVSFGFEVRDAAHVIEVVWPARLVDVLKAERFKSSVVGKGQSNWSEKMSEDLQAADVELRAVLGEVRVKLGDIVDAEPGDILTCESLTEVKIYAGDRPILEGSLGAHRGHNAVKVKSPVLQKYFGEPNG
jgi:flagellar motor switch protein FliM